MGAGKLLLGMTGSRFVGTVDCMDLTNRINCMVTGGRDQVHRRGRLQEGTVPVFSLFSLFFCGDVDGGEVFS